MRSSGVEWIDVRALRLSGMTRRVSSRTRRPPRASRCRRVDRRIPALAGLRAAPDNRPTPSPPRGGAMARIPLVTRDQIAQKEQPAYDAFMASRTGRPNIGPYSLLLHMPEMAQRLEALRTYLRDEASLSQKLQELVMISVAAEMGCAFMWYAPAAPARQAGIRGDVIDAIRERRPPAGLDADEQAAVDFTRELLQNRRVSRPTFEAANARFGQRGTMTLTNLVACYAVLAYNM